MLFVKLPYTLATEEAERIGLDHVARSVLNGVNIIDWVVSNVSFALAGLPGPDMCQKYKNAAKMPQKCHIFF